MAFRAVSATQAYGSIREALCGERLEPVEAFVVDSHSRKAYCPSGSDPVIFNIRRGGICFAGCSGSQTGYWMFTRESTPSDSLPHRVPISPTLASTRATARAAASVFLVPAILRAHEPACGTYRRPRPSGCSSEGQGRGPRKPTEPRVRSRRRRPRLRRVPATLPWPLDSPAASLWVHRVPGRPIPTRHRPAVQPPVHTPPKVRAVALTTQSRRRNSPSLRQDRGERLPHPR